VVSVSTIVSAFQYRTVVIYPPVIPCTASAERAECCFELFVGGVFKLEYLFDLAAP